VRNWGSDIGVGNMGFPFPVVRFPCLPVGRQFEAEVKENAGLVKMKVWERGLRYLVLGMWIPLFQRFAFHACQW